MLEITVLVFLTTPGDEAAIMRDAKRLEGNWEIVAVEQKGKKSSPDDLRFSAVVFADAKAFGKPDGRGGTVMNVTLDPSRKPKQIAAMEANPGKGRALCFAGVYR